MKTKLKIIIPAAVAVIAVIIAMIFIKLPEAGTVDTNSLMSTAQKYLVEMNYEQAVAKFEKIIELEPNNVDAYLGLAQAYRDSGDIDKAIEVLEKGYELTGDERLKVMLEQLLGDISQTETSTVTEISEIAVEPAEINIPDGALAYNGHSYFVFADICNTWEEAEEYCESLGGYLAVINDDEENTAVYNIMNQLGFENAYFGYTDREEEGKWCWVNGSDSDYENWAENEPSNYGINGDENYGMYYYSYEYEWNDGDAVGLSAFICEWDTPCEKIYAAEPEYVYLLKKRTKTTQTDYNCGDAEIMEFIHDDNGYITDIIRSGEVAYDSEDNISHFEYTTDNNNNIDITCYWYYAMEKDEESFDYFQGHLIYFPEKNIMYQYYNDYSSGTFYINLFNTESDLSTVGFYSSLDEFDYQDEKIVQMENNTFIYNSDGLISEIIDDTDWGISYKLFYNENNQIEKIEEHSYSDILSQYEYDSNGNLIKEIHESNVDNTYYYYGNLTITYEYDEHNNLIRMYRYDPDGVDMNDEDSFMRSKRETEILYEYEAFPRDEVSEDIINMNKYFEYNTYLSSFVS